MPFSCSSFGSRGEVCLVDFVRKTIGRFFFWVGQAAGQGGWKVIANLFLMWCFRSALGSKVLLQSLQTVCLSATWETVSKQDWKNQLVAVVQNGVHRWIWRFSSFFLPKFCMIWGFLSFFHLKFEKWFQDFYPVTPWWDENGGNHWRWQPSANQRSLFGSASHANANTNINNIQMASS